MYQDRHLDPEASACLLEVNGLPDYFDDNRLYDVFRPFGPLNLCKCVMNDGSFQGGAFIQFFHQNNSDEAQNNLDGHLVDGYKLSVAPYMPAKPMLQQKEKVSENNDNNAVVDIMNLYIKNLDPHITTQDLNRLFGQFGRIISARVMTNTATGQSKGYGFVSFGKPEEAAAALSEMNGCTVGSRQIIVAYHEPKKGRNNQQQQQQPQQQQQQQLQQQYRPTSVCQPHPYFDQPQPYQPSVSGLGIDHVDEIDMSMNVKDLSVGQKPMYRKPLEQYSPVTTSTGKSLASLASGASIQPAPPNYVQLPPKRPTLRRKGSLESVMTATSFGLQRAKLEAAVNRIGDYGDATVDIVDMLLTLKKKERSLCLFNPDFLKEKIDAALDALVTCEESEGSEDEETNLENNITLYQSQRKELTQITPVYNIASQSNNTTPPPKTKAIPIVAPPSVPSPPASSQATASKDNNEEAQALVASFEGKPIHEKKQLLGDKLFPLVKATGTKQAPKVTIRLLDTIDLYELAKIMFDTPLLKSRVEEAFNSLQQ